MLCLLAAIVNCYVGCGAGARDGQTLHVLKCDTDTGSAEIVQTVSVVQGTTYFAFDAAGRNLYSYIGEKKDGGKRRGVLVRFDVSGGTIGEMTRIAELPCETPCHIALSPDGSFAGFAAYSSATAGSVSLKDGVLHSTVHPDEGLGTDRKRQNKAHAHCATFTPDSSAMGVVDLGTDRILFYDPATMAPKPELVAHADPGDGPRHVAWTPDGRFMFVLNELGNSVIGFSYDGKKFARTGKWSTLPAGSRTDSKAAAIKLTADGRILMASNRGDDSIAFFDVDVKAGTLALRSVAKLAGRFPRDFELMPGEKFMVVGHKLDDEIRIYGFDREKCALAPVGPPVRAWHPQCFKFMPSAADAVVGDIGDTLRASVACGDVAGAVSVVSGPDYSMRIDCVGYADREKGIPMRPDTVFAMFSSSKSVCGTAVMILVADGKLSLDDPVAKYIPEFADVKVEESDGKGGVKLVPPKRPVTVRDMMSHMSGSRFRPSIVRRDFPLMECARQLAATPFKYHPGETFAYNNGGIDVGGAVVQVASGMPYERFLEERIFKPLGMRDTTFTPNAEQISRMARCYNGDGAKLFDQAKARVYSNGICCPLATELEPGMKIYPAPSAGLYSTPLDFARYSQMLAHRGEWQGVRILPENLFMEVFTVKQTPASIDWPYTLGNWIRGEWFGHSGALKTDQRVNIRTGHSRCYFVQISPPGGAAFERSKDAWNLAVDKVQCREGASPCNDYSTPRSTLMERIASERRK